MKPIQTITLNPAFDIHYGMDSFEARKENYVKSAVIQAGGKGINISRALTENGISNIAYVALARENAATFEQELQKDGLAYVPFYTSGRIRENITLHPANDRETRISLDTFYADQAILDAIEQTLMNEDLSDSLLAFSGRLPRGIEKSAVIAFLKRMITRGVRVVVDSNSFSADDLREIHPWFIKPNEQEIAAFSKHEIRDRSDAAAIACDMVKSGVAQEVMITLGGDGAAWSDGKQKLCFQVPKLAHPVSTIGAGDSTVAGLLAATTKAYASTDAFRLALAYGTAACLTPGTLPPKSKDIERIYAQIKVQPL
ncbi:MAG: hexose kinase [Clostridia bacterium]|nr:hexose kinase [Clostridia bacterium]